MENNAPAQPVSESKVIQTPSVSEIPNSPPIKPKPKFPLVTIIIILAFLVLAGCAAGFYIFKPQIMKLVTKPTPNVIPGLTRNPASPTPSTAQTIDTSNWKTYTNRDNGFSFRYDSGSELDDGSAGNEPIIRLYDKKFDFNRNFKDLNKPYQLAADNENYFTLQITKLDSNKYSRCKGFDESKKFLIGGYDAFYSELNAIQGGGPGYSKIICLEKGGYRYEFFNQYLGDSPVADHENIKNIFDQTLSTFEFTDSQTVDTSNWKTYIDPTFKYSLEYPSETFLDIVNYCKLSGEDPGSFYLIADRANTLINCQNFALYSMVFGISPTKNLKGNDFWYPNSNPDNICFFESKGEVLVSNKKVPAITYEINKEKCPNPVVLNYKKETFLNISHNGTDFRVFYSTDTVAQKDVDKILSTFKFTN